MRSRNRKEAISRQDKRNLFYEHDESQRDSKAKSDTPEKKSQDILDSRHREKKSREREAERRRNGLLP